MAKQQPQQLIKVYQRRKRKRREDEQPIDHIPNCYQQRRRTAGGSKPRIDFSLLICASPPHHEDILRESFSSKEVLSSVTVGSSDEENDTRTNTLEPSQNHCSESGSKQEELVINCVEVPVTEVKSFGQNEPFGSSSNRNNEERSDSTTSLELTPDKSQNTEDSILCITPGSVVWAKTSERWWWPAEIVGGKSNLVCSGAHNIAGHVLVQYYAKEESAWVDPARDLSPFEESFEERSCNPVEEFQNALRLALDQKERLRSCKQLFHSPDTPDFLNQLNQSPEKENSTSSSRAGTDDVGRGRSKRERKRKVHFDEVSFPLKATKKVRRLRIMRFLGLAAPVGSPFCLGG